MTKTEIIYLLKENHNRFIRVLEQMDEKQFTTLANDKWNSGQQLDHISRAVGPVALAFTLPPFLLRWIFGKTNRPSKSYEGLMEKYKFKLAAGGRASGRFLPKTILFSERANAIKTLNGLVQRLTDKIETLDENQLDELLLPHPLLGKLTWREMLYFTAYHVVHHEEGMKKNLENIGYPLR